MRIFLQHLPVFTLSVKNDQGGRIFTALKNYEQMEQMVVLPQQRKSGINTIFNIAHNVLYNLIFLLL